MVLRVSFPVSFYGGVHLHLRTFTLSIMDLRLTVPTIGFLTGLGGYYDLPKIVLLKKQITLMSHSVSCHLILEPNITGNFKS